MATPKNKEYELAMLMSQFFYALAEKTKSKKKKDRDDAKLVVDYLEARMHDSMQFLHAIQ